MKINQYGCKGPGKGQNPKFRGSQGTMGSRKVEHTPGNRRIDSTGSSFSYPLSKTGTFTTVCILAVILFASAAEAQRLPAPRHIAPGALAPQALAPQALAPQALAPRNIAPQNPGRRH